MNIHLQRALSFPFVRTSLYAVGGGLVGAVGGLLVSLFIGGVIAVVSPSFGASARDVISGLLPIGMLMGALATSILTGVVSVKTTPSGDLLVSMDEGCCGDGSCEGCECCSEEPEEMIVVEAPKV